MMASGQLKLGATAAAVRSWHTTLRVCVPGPHVVEQAPQSPACQAKQSTKVQVSVVVIGCVSGLQSLVVPVLHTHVRVNVPLPHVTLHGVSEMIQLPGGQGALGGLQACVGTGWVAMGQ